MVTTHLETFIENYSDQQVINQILTKNFGKSKNTTAMATTATTKATIFYAHINF